LRKSLVNMSDVATQAGVSKSTVSRVLNNRLGEGFSVSDDVRQRIITVAREMNYRPNLIAQSLTNNCTQMISVLGGAHALSDLGNIYQTAVNAITTYLASASEEFDVTVDMSRPRSDVSELPSWKIAGAIVLARSTSVTMTELERTAIPYVVVNGPSGPNGSSVVLDDIGGTHLAVSHLIELGHQRIAYAGPHKSYLIGHSSVVNRHQKYLSDLAKYGLSPIIPGHDAPLESTVAFLKSVVFKHGATAIIAYGHMEGLHLMQAAHTLGISIPEQLSLICFCDEYAANIMSPDLTFVDLRSEQMGRVATKLLLRQIGSLRRAKPECIKLAERLVINNSTAPALSEADKRLNCKDPERLSL